MDYYLLSAFNMIVMLSLKQVFKQLKEIKATIQYKPIKSENSQNKNLFSNEYQNMQQHHCLLPFSR